MSFKTWYFDSTAEAYDASQERDDIKDGDLLVVPKEGVYGFLQEAWPIAYEGARWPIAYQEGESGTKHEFHVVSDWGLFVCFKERYGEVWEAAKQLWKLHHHEKEWPERLEEHETSW